jgi:hypothetical protein
MEPRPDPRINSACPAFIAGSKEVAVLSSRVGAIGTRQLSAFVGNPVNPACQAVAFGEGWLILSNRSRFAVPQFLVPARRSAATSSNSANSV